MSTIKIDTVRFRGQSIECMANQLSLKLDPEIAKDSSIGEKAVRESLGSGVSFHFVFPFDERGIAAIEIKGRASLESVVDRLEKSPEIMQSAPISIDRLSAGHTVINRPGDPLFPQQWGAKKIRLPEAWGYALQTNVMLGADKVCVAVLDTGLPFAGNPPKPFHEDLEDPKRFLLGRNYISTGVPPNDDHWHGTHVTGIIASEHGKRRGIAGVNWRCMVYVEKVFDSSGGGSRMFVYQGMMDSIRFARSRGLRLIINYSGGGAYDPVLDEEIGRAVTDAGALLVAAAGNDSGPVAYPAALSTREDGSVWYSNVCAVGATDQNDVLAPFSNFGPQINVTAPGVDIISAMPYPVNTPSRYDLKSGTSMAAPFVSGVASLIWAKNHTLAAGHVREQLEATAVDLGVPGRDPQYGFGRVDAYRALREM
jgi:thermitase